MKQTKITGNVKRKQGKMTVCWYVKNRQRKQNKKRGGGIAQIMYLLSSREEVKDANWIGRTRDLFKKIFRTFYAKMSITKDKEGERRNK